MKRRKRRIRRALKRAGLYNAFHITLIAVLLTGFCVILFNVKESEQQEKEPEEVQAEVTQNPETAGSQRDICRYMRNGTPTGCRI